MSTPTPTPTNTPVLAPQFPLYAVVSTTNGVTAVGTTCHILLCQDGTPLLAQDGDYIATQGSV